MNLTYEDLAGLDLQQHAKDLFISWCRGRKESDIVQSMLSGFRYGKDPYVLVLLLDEETQKRTALEFLNRSDVHTEYPNYVGAMNEYLSCGIVNEETNKASLPNSISELGLQSERSYAKVGMAVFHLLKAIFNYGEGTVAENVLISMRFMSDAVDMTLQQRFFTLLVQELYSTFGHVPEEVDERVVLTRKEAMRRLIDDRTDAVLNNRTELEHLVIRYLEAEYPDADSIEEVFSSRFGENVTVEG